MAGVIDGSLQSLDGKASPVTFMAESPTEKVFSQPLSTGTRRGSFLFRSESDDRTPPHTVVTMTGSASAARLTSMIPEMFVIASQLHYSVYDYYIYIFIEQNRSIKNTYIQKIQ